MRVRELLGGTERDRESNRDQGEGQGAGTEPGYKRGWRGEREGLGDDTRSNGEEPITWRNRTKDGLNTRITICLSLPCVLEVICQSKGSLAPEPGAQAQLGLSQRNNPR